MTRLISRADYDALPALADSGPFAPGWGKHVVIHYTGISERPDPDSFEAQADYLRGLQSYYQSGKHPNGNPIGTFPNGAPRYRPFSDIGYNLAVFFNGRIFEARGLAMRSGANGNAASNAIEPSILLAGLDVNETPTPEMIDAVRWLITYLREYTGQRTMVKGHRDVYVDSRGRPLTTCPGDIAYEMVVNGTFLPESAAPVPLPPPTPPAPPIPTEPSGDDDMLTYFRNAESRSVPTQPNPNTPDGKWFPGQVIYVFNANTGITRRARELEVAFKGGEAWANTLPMYTNAQIDNMIAANTVTI